MEDLWISRSRLRDASSSGAARTSSSSCLIIVPMRMTLAGCSTRSATSLLFLPSSPSTAPFRPAPGRLAAPSGTPSGPTTTTCRSCPAWPAAFSFGSFIPSILPLTGAATPTRAGGPGHIRDINSSPRPPRCLASSVRCGHGVRRRSGSWAVPRAGRRLDPPGRSRGHAGARTGGYRRFHRAARPRVRPRRDLPRITTC